MRFVISGASGLIGRALAAHLTARGHEVTRLVRRDPAGAAGAVRWDPERGRIDAAGLEGHDVVIHLAGEPILGVWTKRKKEWILASRVEGTRLLSETLARLERPPQVLIVASAVGYYGPRPAGVVDEGSGPGEGFLAEVVRRWEEASRVAEEGGIRVVRLRFGVVLSREGGVLGAMLPWFRVGLGARIGSGQGVMSWVARSELGYVVEHVVARRELAGPVNVVVPEPASMAEFAATLARVVGRRAWLVVPEWVVRLVGGEMAREAVLSSQAVHPSRLLESGYSFRYPELEIALRHELQRGELPRRRF